MSVDATDDGRADETGPTSGLDPADLEWLSLESGEAVLWADGPDKRTMLPTLAIGIPLSLVLIGIFIIVGEYFRVTNTHYVVTNKALYRKTGILSRDVKRIEFGKVQNISYSQSALGNQFGYGTVEIATAGSSGTEMAFRSVQDPRDVQQLVSDRLSRPREGDEERSNEDVLVEVLEELRTIRRTMETATGAGRSGSSRNR